MLILLQMPDITSNHTMTLILPKSVNKGFEIRKHKLASITSIKFSFLESIQQNRFRQLNEAGSKNSLIGDRKRCIEKVKEADFKNRPLKNSILHSIYLSTTNETLAFTP